MTDMLVAALRDWLGVKRIRTAMLEANVLTVAGGKWLSASLDKLSRGEVAAVVYALLQSERVCNVIAQHLQSKRGMTFWGAKAELEKVKQTLDPERVPPPEGMMRWVE